MKHAKRRNMLSAGKWLTIREAKVEARWLGERQPRPNPVSHNRIKPGQTVAVVNGARLVTRPTLH